MSILPKAYRQGVLAGILIVTIAAGAAALLTEAAGIIADTSLAYLGAELLAILSTLAWQEVFPPYDTTDQTGSFIAGSALHIILMTAGTLGASGAWLIIADVIALALLSAAAVSCVRVHHHS